MHRTFFADELTNKERSVFQSSQTDWVPNGFRGTGVLVNANNKVHDSVEAVEINMQLACAAVFGEMWF